MEGINWKVKVPTAQRASPGFDVALANLLVLHGEDVGPGDATVGFRTKSHAADVSLFEEENMYTPWSPTPVTVWRNSKPMAGHKKSAGLISNTKAGASVVV